jgi:hypothetical protein
MDAAQLNQQLDAELLAEGVVSHELYLRLADAHSYGAASTIGWVEARLGVLAKRLKSGASLAVYLPAAKQPVPCRSLAELQVWAAEHFPDAEVARE